MPRTSRSALGLVAALVLTASACSSSGGAQSETPAPGAASGSVPGGERFTIQMITHETPGDTFWDKIRTGAEAAAAKSGVELQYSNNPQAAGQAGLINNAVDSRVDGIATTLSSPDALAGAVQAARSAGIPVVAFNAGIDDYEDVGATQYFGSDESLAGETVGRRLADEGAERTLCVLHEEGSVSLEARCAGVREGQGSTENIQVNGADLASVTSTLQAKLAQDEAIDSVVTLGAPIALAALQAKKDAGSEAKVVTFDLNAETAEAISSGELAFSVDQQPYLQGYLAVESLWLYLTNRNEIGGGQATLTGPSFVDASNIAQIAEYASRGTR